MSRCRKEDVILCATGKIRDDQHRSHVIDRKTNNRSDATLKLLLDRLALRLVYTGRLGRAELGRNRSTAHKPSRDATSRPALGESTACHSRIYTAVYRNRRRHLASHLHVLEAACDDNENPTTSSPANAHCHEMTVGCPSRRTSVSRRPSSLLPHGSNSWIRSTGPTNHFDCSAGGGGMTLGITMLVGEV